MILKLKHEIQQAISEVYDLEGADIVLTPTRKEFDGDYTFVVFPLVKALRKKPEDIAHAIGEKLVTSQSFVREFNVVKGFLNLSLRTAFWTELLSKLSESPVGRFPETGKKFVVEYCSPNTNKPLHLGHIRNILLGWSVSNILEAVGHSVHRTQIINDRGIAICKSMLAWQRYGQGNTPDKLNIKSDHYVGDMYVAFNNALKEEYKAWTNSPAADSAFERQDKFNDRDTFFAAYKNDYFNKDSELGRASRDLLIKWEDGHEETVDLWKRMNNWVYDGFEETYRSLGVSFDSHYYESDTYKLGKEFVEKGLGTGIFYKKDDGSVWVDLEPFGMDHKILMRSDGTSVYMTQDLGTAHQRFEDTGMDAMVYTVGNEQDYHFKALFAILKMLDEPYAKDLFHLSYGMVELPSGKMKSREGTVVDADDLIAEVIGKARENAAERGEISMLPFEEQVENIQSIGLAALKYHMLKVDPKKRMIFNPEESVDLHGQTGPYIQNAFVRIRSILRKLLTMTDVPARIKYDNYKELHSGESGLLRLLAQFPEELHLAANKYDPSTIANYAYGLAKEFHRFYHDVPILQAETSEARNFRIALIKQVAATLERSMALLGIQMPQRM